MGADGNDRSDGFGAAAAFSARANEYLIAWSGDPDPPQANDEFEVFARRFGAGPLAAVCKALPPPPPPSPGDPDDITLTTGQLLINQRIDQAAIRRANGVEAWLGDGVEGRDLCQGALGTDELGPGIVTDLAGIPLALVAPDPRPIVVAAAKPADPSQIRLTTGQLLINQRISQAAIRRLNGLKARLDGGLTGGDVDDATLPSRPSSPACGCWPPRPRRSAPAASATIVAPASAGDPSQITLTTTQLLINQRISQAAVRRANELMAPDRRRPAGRRRARRHADRARPGARGRAVTRAPHPSRRVRRRIAPGLVAVSVACCAWPASGAVDDLDLVSRTSAGAPADAPSFDPSISADGRLVAFASEADNLSTEDLDALESVFVRDLDTGTTTLVSRQSAALGGAAADDSSDTPSISADGRFVAFVSSASNLAAEATASRNVYVRDLQAQTTTLVSRQSAADGGAGADDQALDPAISADGRYVVFDSFADNLSDEDATVKDVFVRDLQAQTTTLVSRQSASAGGDGGDGNSFAASISADGRVVAFGSTADNLSTADPSPQPDLFVRDLDAATTALANRATGRAGAVGDRSVSTSALSADGRAVAFISAARNLSAEDDDAADDVFVRDLDADATTLVSRADGPTGPGGDGSALDVGHLGRRALRRLPVATRTTSRATTTRRLPTSSFATSPPRRRGWSAGRRGRPAPAATPARATPRSRPMGATWPSRRRPTTSPPRTWTPTWTPKSNDVFRRDLLGPAPGSPSGAGASGGASAAVCKALPPPPRPSPGDPDDITLTTGQLLINQRIDQAAIRRANGVQDWIDGGVEGRDLCRGALAGGELAAGIVSDLAGPVVALAAPDPRPIAVAAAKPSDTSRITLTTRQLLINQRISQAAIRRLNGLKARLDAGLTGGDVDDRTLPQPAFVAGLRVLAAPVPASPPAASTTRIAPAKPGDPESVTLTTAQLLINQRISQAAVRRANELMARIEDGLVASDVRDGTLTALDLAPGVAP